MLGAGVAEATGRSDQDVNANGSLTLDEIVTQPDCWERAAVLGQHHEALPPAGARVLVLGCGTSYYVGQAYATLRERAGQGHTDATVASELSFPLTRSYDRVIAISRSGTTVELVNALEGLPGGLPVTVLLGDPDTPLGRAGHDVVDLQFADEVSVVQTRFATTGLSLLRASLGDTLEGDVLGARAALLAELPAFPDQQLVVLAHGWATALAQEAALKCREAAGIWAEAYPDGEYRHGPLAVAGPHTLVWGLTPLSDKLVEAITATGAHVEQPRHPAQAELVRLQRFAVGWAAARGRNADQPVHLSRSVTEV